MRHLWIALPFVVACVPMEPPEALPPDPLALVALRDLDPDPKVVEVSIEAAIGTQEYLPGKPAEVWGYRDASLDGSPVRVPGPTLEANQGDTIVVHFRNALPVPTTVHWHGLRLPAGADGSTSTQDPIQPGGTYEARFVAGDAGTFWYHPHVHADEQIERGLQAAFIVHEPEPVEAAADRVLILDDVKLEATGRLSTTTDALDVMLGRQGNVLLVNGLNHPRLSTRPGARERWRFIDSANGRYFRLHMPGRSFQVIAWDGGLLEAPYQTDELLIAPGERYEVLVEPGAELETLHYDRGHEVPDPGPKALFSVDVAGDPVAPLPAYAGGGGTAARALVSPSTPVRRAVLREQDDEAGLRFLINDQAWPFNTPVMVETGTTEIWEVENNSDMDHPFHIHGLFFEILDVGGRPPIAIGAKDTLNIPQHQTARLAVRYGALGMWMFHCHILEHAERGMMGVLMVMP